MEEENSDDEKESVADRARLLDSDSEPEQPDPVAARACIDPYLDDIDGYMRSLEERRRPRDYMPMAVIRPSWRAILVDWLVEVTDEFKLLPDTLHLAVSYLDRFLSVRDVVERELQLLGVAALLVAAKYDSDRYVHDVESYSYITDTYTQQQVVEMEADILNLLKFEMGSPTARTFLRKFLTACRSGDDDGAKARKLEFMCSYLADLSLVEYECTRFKPSVVAASCLFVAWFTISPSTCPWNLTLQRNTEYKVSDLESCILKIHRLQLIGTYSCLKGKAIKDKYSHCELERVSKVASPREIPKYFLKDIKQ